MADYHTLSKKQEEILSYLKDEILTRGGTSEINIVGARASGNTGEKRIYPT